jgi:hypothetical protein
LVGLGSPLVGIAAILLLSLRFGYVGPILYCALLPGSGFVYLAKLDGPWDTLIAWLANIATMSLLFGAFGVRGPWRWPSRVFSVVGYVALAWFTFVGFARAFGER